ncbi:hypothetical protein CXF83_14970 [Shewanella sp. Choline-02u-19]|uniref:hypothetical protein n=1 Tax=unclassified Shewanella TaxID=196818 RepID=UPI000C336811|nr:MULTISPECIES: hypothetical protein [unclassified Shewanella]PKH62569.1 hypothetical protein CXF84_00960 [Shewanella sp. Bg11-22]PKI27920.1 hypothetical protein CXF83_14970 [Shewanella sp. Choline-02u-19]
MLNFADKAKSKLERGWRKLAAPCQFIPATGEPPFERGMNLLPTQSDMSREYLMEPIQLVEWLKADGAVNVDDEFVMVGKRYQLTKLYEFDPLTVSFVYLEL